MSEQIKRLNWKREEEKGRYLCNRHMTGR